jgi:hypothetical protein
LRSWRAAVVVIHELNNAVCPEVLKVLPRFFWNKLDPARVLVVLSPGDKEAAVRNCKALEVEGRMLERGK